ncbi:ankyrin repeat and SOCS box protein 17-like [Scomber japonicus]|uniref:ankyrin repeat and SOCS box protein 17-like n=1 Tax=Scomber japonicus TaxID=13676 RepID=UPI002305BCAD|nr:ankyrin repeat and SOCS box protein 17-like [Scomber japonicus]
MGNTTSQGSTPQRQTPRVDLSPAGWEISSEAESHELYRAVCRMSEARDPQCFHQAMLDALSAAQSARAGLDSQQYRRFINTWTNWALFYVCHRVSNSGNAGELMKKISMYVQHETDEMACAWRYFTLSDTISGLSTVLSVVAKNCHIDALRILLQHGMLEKERRPNVIINVILFSPLPLVEENGCIQFGFHVKLLSFKVQVRSGRMPLTEDWNDHIPHGRCAVPCELSHLCRVAIRRRLLGRALLPKGIFELPLPESLKKYLNLEA